MLRGFVVWGGGTALVLIPFLVFVANGWPGAPDACTLQTPNTCFCEAFVMSDVLAHRAGVRQPSNTWYNLYSIIASGLIATVLYFDRRAGCAKPVIRSRSCVPDLFVFVVLFLGLGSMWFHASLVAWGGNFDGLSMYGFAAFLLWYTIYRVFASELLFWLGYSVTVVAFSLAHVFWSYEQRALVLVLSLVGLYLVAEVFVWRHTGKILQNRVLPIVLWLSALASIFAATLFWALSQTGGPLCWPESAFQPHGLLWHPLAGVMAMLLYFYWRESTTDA